MSGGQYCLFCLLPQRIIGLQRAVLSVVLSFQRSTRPELYGAVLSVVFPCTRLQFWRAVLSLVFLSEK